MPKYDPIRIVRAIGGLFAITTLLALFIGEFVLNAGSVPERTIFVIGSLIAVLLSVDAFVTRRDALADAVVAFLQAYLRAVEDDSPGDTQKSPDDESDD